MRWFFSFVLFICGCAFRPVANAGLDQVIIGEERVKLDGSNSRNAIRYKWLQLSGDAVNLEQNEKDPYAYFDTSNQELIFEFELTVFSKINKSAKDSVKISVSPKCKWKRGDRTLVVIDWTGRSVDPTKTGEMWWQNSHAPSPGIDFSKYNLYTSQGVFTGTLANINVENFKEIVRKKVIKQYENITPEIRFVTGEAENYTQATKIYLLQAWYKDDPTQGYLGIAVIDHGNQRIVEDTGLIFGNRVALVGNERYPGMTDEFGYAYDSVEQWANFFANMIAHEAGHTFGFDHPNMNDTGWTYEQKQVETMIGSTNTVFYFFPHAFRFEQKTLLDTTVVIPGCIAEEYDLTSQPAWPDHPYFR